MIDWYSYHEHLLFNTHTLFEMALIGGLVIAMSIVIAFQLSNIFSKSTKSKEVK